MLLVLAVLIPEQPLTGAQNGESIVLTPKSEGTLQLTDPVAKIGDGFHLSNEDHAMRAKLATIDLVRFREPGQQLTLRKFQVEQQLRDAGVEEIVLLKGDFPVQLKVGTDTLPESVLRNRIDAYFDGGSGQMGGQVHWEFIGTPDIRIFPGSSPALHVTHQGELRPGRMALQVKVTSGDYSWTKLVPVNLKLADQVYILATDVQRGAPITTANTKPTTRFLDLREWKYALRSIGEGEHTARTNLRAGDVVLSTMVQLRDLIRSGDQVKLVLEYGRVRVEGVGRAIENGAISEEVRVREKSSGKVLTGRVIGEGRIRIEALGNL